ncbi:MAG TPA: hypothetical protein VJT15_18590 [Pyrinomonadaceae bacterium]|nr:hypothetical protein [Pyrinomonadaceae bacterium]
MADQPEDRSAALLKMRFEATIFPGRKELTADWANELDIDRVPDAGGQVRALITVEDLVRLLDQGLEVRLTRAHASEPLDPTLIVTDESFKQWLDERVKSLKSKPGPKPFIDPNN